MERALQAAERLWLDTPVYLSAQAHLQAYYGRYGFVAVTEVYPKTTSRTSACAGPEARSAADGGGGKGIRPAA